MRFPLRFLGPIALACFALGSTAEARPALPQQPASAGLNAELTAKFDAYLDAHHALDQFSGAVLVADRDQIVYQGARGMANSDWDIANTPATKFRIASMTKQFTALLILQLVDEGVLELDAPITRYLPDYPAESGDQVHLRHLLNHTSGIPSYTDRPGFMRKEAKERMSVAEFVAAYCAEPLEFEPGSQFNYNNSGYFLLGAIIEAVTGQTYAAALEERIFTPLGMVNSGVDDQYQVIAGRATGYDDILGGRNVALWLDMSTPGAAGAMYSTVGDLWRWDRALRARTLLDGELERAMYAPGLGDYAFGWEVTELPAETGGSLLDPPRDQGAQDEATTAPPRTAYYHGGGMPGVSTLIWRIPNEDRCIIILGNTMQTSAYQIRDGLSELLAGREPRPVRARGDFEIARIVLEAGPERALEDLAKWPETTRNDYIRPDVIGISHRLLDQGRTDDALQLCTFLTRAFPDDPGVWDALAYAHRMAGDIPAAIANYKKLVELDPSADSIRDLIKELEG